MRGGLWLSLRSATNTLVGFLYWLLLSLIIGPEQVGVASAVVTTYTVVTGISYLGIPSALQKFIASSLKEGKKEEADTYFWSAVTFIALLNLGFGVLFMVLGQLGVTILSFSEEMMLFTGLLVCVGWASVLDALLIAHRRVRENALLRMMGSFARLVIGLILVLHGLGWTGAVLGYLSGFSLAAFGLGAYSLKIVGLRPPSIAKLFKLLKAGVSIYLPNAIRLVGQQASVLAVFGVGGGFETGPYFMAYMGATVAMMFSNMLFSYLIPVLSRVDEEKRKILAYKVVKLGMLITSLIASELFSFPEFMLGMIGKEYVVASFPLRILSLSAVLSSLVFASSVVTFVMDKYHLTLGIGLSTSVPRLILYYLLTPQLGSLGASLAFMVGGVMGVIAAYLSLRGLVDLFSKEIMLVSTIPFLVSTLLSMIWAPLGMSMALVVTTFLLTRTGLLKKGEVKLVLESVIPGRLLKIPKWLVNLMFG